MKITFTDLSWHTQVLHMFKKSYFGYCTGASVFVLEACRNGQLSRRQLGPVTCAAIELCLLRC